MVHTANRRGFSKVLTIGYKREVENSDHAYVSSFSTTIKALNKSYQKMYSALFCTEVGAIPPKVSE